MARKKGEWVASNHKDGEKKEQQSESEQRQKVTKKRKHKDGKVVYICRVSYRIYCWVGKTFIQ